MNRGEHNSRQTVHTHVDNPSLESLRDEIDRIDGQVVDLLNDRVRAAAEIGKIKSQLGVDAYDPAREEQVFAKIEGLNTGSIPKDSLRVGEYPERFSALPFGFRGRPLQPLRQCEGLRLA